MKNNIILILLLFIAVTANAITNEYIENVREVDKVCYWLDFETHKAAVVGHVAGDNGIVRAKGKFEYDGETYTVTEIGGEHSWLMDFNDAWRINRSTKVVRFEFDSDETNDIAVSDEFFLYCTSLENVKIKHKGNITFGQSCFEGCVLLNQISIQSPQVVRFGKYCFKDCSSLQTLDYANITASYDDYAFQNCIGLRKFVLPKGVSQWSGAEHNVLDGCTNITAIDLYTEDYITMNDVCPLFGKDSKELTQITGLYVEPNVKKIPDYICYKMPNVVGMVLMNGARPTSIGRYAFAFTKVDNVPYQYNCIEEIGDYAYYSCQNLKQLYLSSTVRTIGKQAFANCPLTSIVVDAYNPPYADCSAFRDCGNDCTDISLVVPIGRETTYRNTFTWDKFFQDYVTIKASSEDTNKGKASLRYNVFDHTDCEDDASASQISDVVKGEMLCITLVATPAVGYVFDYWTENGNKYSTNATCVYNTIDAQATEFVAHFKEIEVTKYTVTAIANNAELGKAYFAYNHALDNSDPKDLTGTYIEVEEDGEYVITLHAEPYAGAVFTHWTWNGQFLSSSATYTDFEYSMQDAVEYVAYFESAPSVNIDVTTSTPEAGYVSLCYDPNDQNDCNSCKKYGTVVTLEDGEPFCIQVKAVANAGYRFVKWTIGQNGYMFSDTAEGTFSDDEAQPTVLYAHFEEYNTHTISVSSNNEDLGIAYIMMNDDMDHNIPFDKKVESFEIEEGDFYDVQFVAEPKSDDVEFTGWTQNDELISDMQAFNFTETYVSKDEHLIAHFEKKSVPPIDNAIPHIEANDIQKAEKIIYQGHLYIIRNSNIYDVLGTKMK